MNNREILRDLARRYRDIALRPEMAERREWWRSLNALESRRPLVLVLPEGAWSELIPESSLQCEDNLLRRWEGMLRRKIYTFEKIRDDSFFEPWFDIAWVFEVGDYGFEVPYHHGEQRGSYHWEGPLKDLDRDLPKLHDRPLRVNREETHRRVALANELFGDLLPARIHGDMWWTMGLTWEAAKLVGLENLMLYMCDQPENVHRLMAFLRDEHMHFIEWFEKEGLLRPNNCSNGVGSGGVGMTDALHPAGEQTSLRDYWGFAESQETVGISPAMFEEFVLPYQVPLLEKYGLNYYGCCEGLESRIDLVLEQVPRLRAVSVAPKADQRKLAEKLAGQYVYYRKADPVPVCVQFSESYIRQDLRHTLTVARDQQLALVLKDTHTVQNEPWRIERWVQIAREEIANDA